MPARILVPVDGSEESRLALAHAIAQFPGEHVILLHVIEPFPDHTKAGGHPGQRIDQIFAERRQLVDEMAELGTQYSGTITTELVYGRPVHVIPRFIETNGIDEVVIGSRGRGGTTGLLLGSVAAAVVRRGPVPVTVARRRQEQDEGEPSSPEEVLVPFDRSVCSRHALEYAFEHFPDATITALFVRHPLYEYDSITSEDDLEEATSEFEGVADDTDDVLEAARRIANQNERRIETAREVGDPSQRILEWIDENSVDHVVIGCHGRDGVARWLLGSVAETVVRRAPTSVTAVK